MPVRAPARRRTIAALAAATALAAGALTGSGPAGALSGDIDGVAFVPTGGPGGRITLDGTNHAVDLGPHVQAFTGHFSGGSGGDLFLYNPGSGADGIEHLATSGDTTVTSVSVGGTYTPVVGDYDGNGVDDVLWYAPGSASDALWLFAVDGSHSSLRLSISGTYRPTAFDANGDGRDDVLWYGPGAVGDSLWLFGPGATTHTTKAVSVGGDYTVVAGEFGIPAAGQPADRLVFFSQSGADYFWTFTSSANHTSALLPTLDGNYQPFAGRFLEETYGSIFFYGPGSTPEVVWAFGPGPGGDVAVQEPLQLNGTYAVQAGDYDGNGLTDLALASGTTTRLFELQYEGDWVVSAITGNPTPALLRTIDMR